MKVFIVCSLAVLSVLAFARADNVSNDLQQLEGDSVASDWLNLEPIDQSNNRIRRSPGKNKVKKPKPPKGSDKSNDWTNGGGKKPKPPKDSKGVIFGGPFVLNMSPNSPNPMPPQPSYPSYPYPPQPMPNQPAYPSYPHPPQSQPPQPQSNPQPNPWQYYG